MKNQTLRCKPASIHRTRWASYATAAAATALAGSQSAEAAIHYSGPLNVVFRKIHTGNTHSTFPLDQPGDFFRLSHFVGSYDEGLDSFNINGIASAAFRGYKGSIAPYVSKLLFGQRISSGSFTQACCTGIVVGSVYGYIGRDAMQWRSPGAGFIGFRFNNGAGVQYGWARIKIDRLRGNKVPFELFDYAYADPGESITAGQMSSDEQGPVEQSPNQGSLGWLALGAVGILAWRKSRPRAAP